MFINNGFSVYNPVAIGCVAHLSHQPFSKRQSAFQFKPDFRSGIHKNPLHKSGKQLTVKALQHRRLCGVLQEFADLMQVYTIASIQAHHKLGQELVIYMKFADKQKNA